MLFLNGRDYTQLAGNQCSPFEPVISIMRYGGKCPVFKMHIPLYRNHEQTFRNVWVLCGVALLICGRFDL